MELNTESKNKLRAKIVEELKGVPANKKVKLDKYLLESLLFDELKYTISNGNKTTTLNPRIPVWSGEFLRNIDLSEVDFTNVSWSSLGFDCKALAEKDSIFPREILKKIEQKRTSLENRKYLVNYSCSNANIDLSKSFEAINIHNIDIRKCNFAGLDFSKQELDDINGIYVIESDISGTKLHIPFTSHLEAYSSSLCGLDLSDITIDGWHYLGYLGGKTTNLTYCKLCGTHINIDLRLPLPQGFDAILCEAMRTSLINCYINGTLIKSPAKLKSEKTELQKQYQLMESEEITAVVTSIQKQLGTYPKK